MTERTTHPDAEADRPSGWAVALFVASALFAILSVALLTTGYGLR